MCRRLMLLTPVLFKVQLHVLSETMGTHIYLVTASAPSIAQKPLEEGEGFHWGSPTQHALGAKPWEAVPFGLLSSSTLPMLRYLTSAFWFLFQSVQEGKC